MELIGDVFDAVILHESDRRDRPEGQIIALLRRGLALGSRDIETFEAASEADAIQAALDDLRDGDLLVIQPDKIDAVLRKVQTFLAEGGPTPVLDSIALDVEVAYAVPVAD
jgi:cyanophycin synthetase